MLSSFFMIFGLKDQSEINFNAIDSQSIDEDNVSENEISLVEPRTKTTKVH